MKNRIIGLLVFIGLFSLGYWKFTRPLPGEVVLDQGRDHVTDIAGVDYNSNPPTSGPHFPVWAKKGVYDRLISDGYLIHSLEHGYVILSYDCSKSIRAGERESRSFLTYTLPLFYSSALVYAHDEPAKESSDSGQLLKHMKVQSRGDMIWFTPENPPEAEVALPDSFGTESCRDLAAQLAEFTKVAERVIVVPRSGMDTPLALTAWNRILKLNSVDGKSIRDFIKTFHNRGPEQTDE